MTAIILAAGRGSRFGDLTINRPKPLIVANGIPLILRTLNSLPIVIARCVIVVGYFGELIVSMIGDKYKHMDIEYIYQNELNGTGGALLKAETSITDKKPFLVLAADDVYSESDLNNIICYNLAYGITWTNPIKSGQVSILVDGNGFYCGRTKPEQNQKCYIGVGAFVLDSSIFDIDIAQLPNGELSIPHSLCNLDKPVKTVLFHNWFPINTPEELSFAEKYL